MRSMAAICCTVHAPLPGSRKWAIRCPKVPGAAGGLGGDCANAVAAISVNAGVRRRSGNFCMVHGIKRPRICTWGRGGWASATPDQRVTLLTDAEPRSTALIQVRAADAGMDGEDGLVVEPYAALLDQPAALALGARHTESDGDVDDEYRLVAGQSKGGQSFR